VLLPLIVPAYSGLDGSGDASSSGGSPDSAETGAVDGVRLINLADEALKDAEPDGPELVRVLTARHHPRLLWVHEHLQHLSSHARVITDPAAHVAEQRRLPWWR
jgi:hypothetical protein